MIPTYNERSNIKSLIEEILRLNSDIHIVVVDDQSPDRTARLVEEFCQQSPRVHLIERTGCRGRGLADLEGLQYAVSQGFDYIISMDADFSHHPKFIPDFLNAIQHHDVVLGSRYAKGGKIIGRHWLKNLASSLANCYVRCLMGTGIRDWTTGFRCYRREILESLRLDRMISVGPSILEEVLYACYRRRCDIFEIPITFVDRTKDNSKIGFAELIDTLIVIFKIRFFTKL